MSRTAFHTGRHERGRAKLHINHYVTQFGRIADTGAFVFDLYSVMKEAAMLRDVTLSCFATLLQFAFGGTSKETVQVILSWSHVDVVAPTTPHHKKNRTDLRALPTPPATVSLS